MMTSCRTIIVKDLPESVTLLHIPALIKEVVPLIRADWPCLVFDFSRVKELIVPELKCFWTPWKRW